MVKRWTDRQTHRHPDRPKDTLNTILHFSIYWVRLNIVFYHETKLVPTRAVLRRAGVYPPVSDLSPIRPPNEIFWSVTGQWASEMKI